MTGHKNLDRSLKRPDSFQDQILNGIKFFSTNKKRVLMLSAPLIVVASAGYAVYSWTSYTANHRRAELAKITSIQSDEQSEVSKKRDDLQKQIDALRNTKPDKDGKKGAVSPEALTKITGMEKQMTDLKPDHSKSTAEFKKFFDSNNDSPEGWMAGLTWASRQLQEGNSAEARKVVEHVAKSSSANKFYQMNSRFMLIGLLEDAGDFDSALKEVDILSKLATDDAKPSVLLAKGRLQYFKKAYPEAKVALNEIIDKHASSPEATKARILLAAIGSV